MTWDGIRETSDKYVTTFWTMHRNSSCVGADTPGAIGVPGSPDDHGLDELSFPDAEVPGARRAAAGFIRCASQKP